jgi:polar amino acid transport system substrate-binding protein
VVITLTRLLLLTICLCSFQLNAEEVHMVFGESIPPFSFPDSDSGIEVEIMTAALAVYGHKLIPSYMPLARVPLVFKQGKVNAAMTDLGQDMQALGAFYGEPAVLYNNVIISLEESNLIIESPEDIAGLSIASFQGAYKRYPQWLMPAKNNDLYSENYKQENQVMLLDLVLSDINIFKYHQIQIRQRLGKALKPVRFHHFTTVNPEDYRPVFWKESIRNDFNAGLTQIMQTGQYQAIYDNYLLAPMPEGTENLN